MEKISFKTRDGVTIKGNYFKPLKKHAPVFILLHMMPSTKESWNEFAEIIQKNGCAALAIDLRGHGESTDQNGIRLDYKEFMDEEHRNSMNDIASAKEFLAGQTDLDMSRIAIAGASIGANLALWHATIDKDVRLIMLLSPGLNYRGIMADEFAPKFKGHVFILASEGDTKSADSSRKLAGIFPGETKLKILKGDMHGTNMFNPEIMDELLKWAFERI
ncbi:MAG: alpha/beta fold hydrolase [Candidatus Methanoperedens sp.]|nr:alpha/beta fold hydrolase [Candidatus Methanoperedens sp.]